MSDILAVAAQIGSSVTFIDLAAGAPVATVEVIAEPHELCLDARREVLYVAHTYRSGFYNNYSTQGNEISVLSTHDHTVREVIDIGDERGPHGMRYDARRDLLYVSVEGTAARSGAVLVLDGETHEVLDRIETMSTGPHWFELAPDGKKGYTTNKETEFVSVLDLEKREFAGKIPLPGSEGIAITADGAKALIAARPDGERNSLRILDTARDEITAVVDTEYPVGPVAFGADGELCTVQRPSFPWDSQPRPGLFSVYEPGDFRLRGQVEVGPFPLNIVVDGTTAYISDTHSGTVAVIDTARPAVLNTIQVDDGAHGMALI